MKTAKTIITEVKSRVEIIREIQPSSIETVLEEKEVVHSKLHIAEHSALWKDHQKQHPDARLELIGVSEGGLFDQKKYVLSLEMQTHAPAQQVKKEVKEEAPTQRKQVILAGCNCGMIVEIGSNKKGEGYVKTYESRGLAATANEYGVASTTQGTQATYGSQSENGYKENETGYKG